MKTLTIIVCTRNRSELLDECLASLTRQTASPEAYDVLIVDNGSTDATPAIIEKYTSAYAHFRTCAEPETGLSHARNTGYRSCTTPWVAYVDDDAKAAGDLAERMLYDILHFGFDAFGGVYLPWYKFGKKKWMDEERFFTNRVNMPEAATELKKGYFSGGNCVFRREALEEIGGFNTEIGMKGDTISYGEETLVQVKLRKLGKKIGWDPQLVIYHVVMPHKLRLGWFFTSMYRNGLDHWETFDERPTREKLNQVRVRGLKNLVRGFFTYLPRIFRKGYYIQNWVIDVFCEYARVRGVLKSGRKKLKAL